MMSERAVGNTQKEYQRGFGERSSGGLRICSSARAVGHDTDVRSGRYLLQLLRAYDLSTRGPCPRMQWRAPSADDSMADTESSRVPLGPFDLVEPIGRGGMGEVWRARHLRDERSAAVKVMLAERAREPEYQRAFRREAHALARLNHPAIATIYDYGRIDATTAEEGPGEFVQGAPWLAMELIEGEPIGELPSSWRWAGLRVQLSRLLDALAHAHAKQVLHRDLKPSNVLVRPDGEICIVDFGVAAVLDEATESGEGEDRTIRGTPAYMAPEQIRGEWRRQGPWTDLYAVGCIAWRIVCGAPPLEGETTTEILRSQLREAPRGYEPLLDVPAELRNWLERLLVKEPRGRFQRAADAAWALASLPELGLEGNDAEAEGTAESGLEAKTISECGPTLQLPAPEARDSPPSTLTVSSSPLAARLGEEDPSEVEKYPAHPPPIASKWKRGYSDEIEPLSASGIELFGARRLPTIGREAERDRIWQALREVDSTGEPCAVLLKGAAGSGKSKLAEWLRCRAEELGAAIGVRADHSRTGGRTDGLEAAIARQFRLTGLSESEAVERMVELLEDWGMAREDAIYDAAGIVAASGLGRGTPSQSGFENRRERNFALRRVLGALARERPVVLWLDDIDRSRESARFVEFLFEEFTDVARGELPVLVVMTARSRRLEKKTEIRDSLESALSEPGSSTIDIEPLGVEEQREMIRRMLRFDEALVDEILERTEGRPLFAVQLVTDWLDRGVLAVGKEGFAMAEEARLTMPKNLYELWRRRLREVVSRFPERRRSEVWWALQQAAALGQRVDIEEWRAALAWTGRSLPEQLGGRLAEAGLAEPVDGGWRFVHGLAVEALEEEAREKGRRTEMHRACARAVEEVYSDRPGETAERRADHLIEAGDLERALNRLFEAVRWRFDRADYEAHSELLERCRTTLDGLTVAEGDPRQLQLWLQEARNANGRGEIDEAREVLERVCEVARAHGRRRHYGRACLVLAYNYRLRSDGPRALEYVEKAREILEEYGDAYDLARCTDCRAAILSRLNQEYERGRELFEEARERYRAIGARHRVLLCDYVFASLDFYAGNLESAEQKAEEVFERAREYGDRFRQASVWNLLGEISRRRGDWGEARDFYEKAEGLYESCGARDAVLPGLNVAQMEVLRGRFEKAEPLLDAVAEDLTAAGLGARLGPVYLGRAACHAASERWEEFDRQIEKARVYLDENDYRMSDLFEMAECAAEVAADRGASECAEELRELARRIRRDLGEEESVGSPSTGTPSGR